MWGVWSDLMEVWLATNGRVFTTKLRPVAEGQILALNHGRQMQIMQLEARAEEERAKRSGIVTPNAMQVPGIGNVALNGNARPGAVPPGSVIVQVPPDPQWRVRRFEEWWKAIRAEKNKAVDLRG